MKPWYQDIAQHMWRHFFSCTDPDSLSEPGRLQYEACQRAQDRFSKLERDIIRRFFTAPPAKNVTAAAADCACKFNVDINKVFNTIKSANRAAAEERGLMERREL